MLRKNKTKKAPAVAGTLYCVGIYLSSRHVAMQVLSARQSLTSVFGMGTGGPSASITPTCSSALAECLIIILHISANVNMAFCTKFNVFYDVYCTNKLHCFLYVPIYVKLHDIFLVFRIFFSVLVIDYIKML